jgi:hypothetical protein
MGKVTSLDVGASFLVSRGLGPFIGGWQNKTKENPMSVAHPTQRVGKTFFLEHRGQEELDSK